MRGSICPGRSTRSRFRRGNRIPGEVVILNPWKMAIESDSSPIAHRAGSQPYDRRPQDTTANGGSLFACFQLKLHWRTRKKPTIGFDQDSAGRNVNNRCIVAWPHAGRHDSMFFDAVSPPHLPPLYGPLRHNGFHCRACQSNFSTRVLPVSPNTRTTYCAVFWPRMYKLPEDDEPR